MKKIAVIMAAAASVMLAGCAKEELSETASGGSTVLSVSIDDGTRTTIGDLSEGKRPLYWANGDKIVVNGVTSNALADLGAQCTTADFSFESLLQEPYNTLYPASCYKDAATVTLPSVASSLPIPLAAQGLDLKALTGVLKITVNAKDADTFISQVYVSSPDRQLCGDFTIDYSTSTLAGADSSQQCRQIAVNSHRSLDSAYELFIPVPAGTYTFSVRVTDDKGNYMTKTTSAEKTIAAGRISAMPAFDFVPEGQRTSDVSVSTAAEWNTFAEKYNAGDYNIVNPLFVNITADLDFTGIQPVRVGQYGGDTGNRYCHASINGNGHSFKNIVGGQDPLVASVDTSGCIVNLTIDETCSFTPDLGVSRQTHFGPFTEYLKGTIRNCTNKASITVTQSASGEANSNNYVGGVVGRIREGLLADCSNTGAITVAKEYVSTSSKDFVVGGVAGYVSNTEGTVSGCSNSGAISVNCTVEPLDAGGIVGRNNGTVDKCTNSGVLSVGVIRASNDPCKNIYIGGVVGSCNDGAVTNCSNTAALTSSSNVKLQFFGGVVGGLTKGSISGNTNSGDITFTAAVRQAAAGGIVGRIAAAGTYEFTGTPATGSINVNDWEASTASYFFLGGLVGRADETGVTIKGNKLNSACSISVDGTIKEAAAKINYGGIGGILGAVSLEKTSGTQVTIEDCNVTSGSGISVGKFLSPALLGVGGILGQSRVGAVIRNCTSNVNLSVINGGKNNARAVHCGGIAGAIFNVDSEISGCTCTAASVNNLYYNNNTINAAFNGNATGGILGSFGYLDGNAAKIMISSCNVSSRIEALRCAIGGLAGYLSNATVKGCHCTGYIADGNYAGGLVGYASESTFGGAQEADACTFNSDKGIVSRNAGSCMNYAGGLAGMVSACTFTGCGSYFGEGTGLQANGKNDVSDKGVVTVRGCAPGSLIGFSDDESIIEDCKAGGKLICEFWGMPGEESVKEAVLDDVTVESYAVGSNNLFVSGLVTLWDGK